jgi:long-chain acyl-CoA synthetase
MAASRYADRPWLTLYDEGKPADIACEHPSALAMFEAAARRAPDRPLLHYFDATLTAREVDDLAGAVAAGLRELGIRPGDRVALYLQNVPQFVISLVAAWKAGAIAVSVNPMLKGRELRFVLDDSGARALVALEGLHRDVAADVLPGSPVETVITTSELEFAAERPTVLEGIERARAEGTHDLLELAERFRAQAPPPPDLGPDDVAVLTYTSGTTGPPKGAMNTHRNVVFTSQTYRNWCELTGEDVVLGIAPLFHITGLIAHIGVGLLLPVPIVLGARFDPLVTAELARRRGATFTVAAITAFIALLDDERVTPEHLATFTKPYSGGAPIAPATADAWEERFGTRIRVAYGLTETTSPSHLTPHRSASPVDERTGALSIGVPVFNTVVRIAGDDGEDLPIGEVGELLTSGPGVVPGYWEKPEETAHALPGGELRTGDVGFMDERGWFYLVDRKKDQINAAGYKVWPREVEDILYEHPAVREAAVVGVSDPYRGESVKAFVSLKAGRAAEPEELIAFCRERLAAYKYPRQVDVLDDLPKTATGKILRRELRDQATARA